MAKKDTLLINDDLFHQTLSCPLKFVHIVENQKQRRASGLLFRQRNKLHIRDAIARQFDHSVHTSNSVEKAESETKGWLQRSSVAICGAVIRHHNLLTRIPILLKNNEKLTIIQVHGKLRKKNEGSTIHYPNERKSIQRYLLKAAYRMEILKRKFPEISLDVDFYFPNKHYKSKLGNIHLFKTAPTESESLFQEEFFNLFSKVNATEATADINEKIPVNVSHTLYKGLSVSQIIERVLDIVKRPEKAAKISRHEGCKYCEYRIPESNNLKGCWNRFFDSADVRNPEKHVFELIGHGNSSELEERIYYQEDATLSKGFRSFEDVNKYGGPTFTFLQRRNLQILQSRNEDVPSLWIKPGVKSVEELRYPLHFIDFEAATYAIPMKSASRPYHPVYFQFSCHTLYENSELIHTEWLDQQHGGIYPHEEFVNQLGMIPDIFNGTIIQYSPFEKQGINRLLGDFKRNPERYEEQIGILKRIRDEKNEKGDRFYDLSRTIRDFYFNTFLSDGLGLKTVLFGILRWEKKYGDSSLLRIKIGDKIVDLNDTHRKNNITDPYMLIQSPEFMISDGSAAMNAWISFKNGLLTKEEQLILPEILIKYCALDSYALLVLFKHLKKFARTIDEKDLIKF